MSDILSKWLNEEVKLSKFVDSSAFAERFSNGYLIGELFHFYGLQSDFKEFSDAVTSESKLNNFMRVQPTMALLDIKFDTKMARDIMKEQPGVAARLLYQLFIILSKKEKLQLSEAVLKTMRSQGAVQLDAVETEMYKERLKALIPRQIDLDFEKVMQKYNDKQKLQEEQAIKTREKEEQRLKIYQSNIRQQSIERARQIREKHDRVMEKIKEATVELPQIKQEIKNRRGTSVKEKEIQGVYDNITAFEKQIMISKGIPLNRDREHHCSLKRGSPASKKLENDKYISEIRKQLNDNLDARKDREKRRKWVLVEQLQSHHDQQELAREEFLVKTLMRESQMEKKIAVQLMNVRKQKEVVKINRLELERQCAERRLKDFQEALDREAELCRQAKLEYAEQVVKQQELHDAIAEQRALKKYEKHYGICKEILLDIVDLSCKFTEYKELTQNAVPPKLVQEWKTLFVNCKPLYEKNFNKEVLNEEHLKEEEEKEALLDEHDFTQYKDVCGDWQTLSRAAQPDNRILGHIVQRLHDIVYPPTPPPPAPELPAYPIKACVLGKCFAGKSIVTQYFAKNHRVKVLDVKACVSEVTEAWNRRDCLSQEVDVENQDGEEASPHESASKECPSKEGALKECPLKEGASKECPSKEYVSKEGASKECVSKECPSKEGALKECVPKESTAVESASKDCPSKEGTSKECVSKDCPSKEGTSKECVSKDYPSKESTAVESTHVQDSSDVKNEEDGNISAEKSSSLNLTEEALLGEQAEEYLHEGKPIPDQLLVDIMLFKIKSLAEGTGWLLDGFPSTLHQAEFLEKGLTGYERIASPIKTPKQNRKSRLAPDPNPPPEPKPPVSGLDVVVLLDVTNETVLQRVEGRMANEVTTEEFHEELHPPTEGSYSGIQNQPQITPVVDANNEKEQIQTRLSAFEDHWINIAAWFQMFTVLTTVDASSDSEVVSRDVEMLLEQTMEKISFTEESVEDVVTEVITKEHVTEATTPDIKSIEVSCTVLYNQDADCLTTHQSKGDISPRKDICSTPTSAPVSPNSLLVPTCSEVSSQSEPTSKFWTFVDNAIDKEMGVILHNVWNTIEDTYISSCKHGFRRIRQENEIILRYFYARRVTFLEFLKRPDEKQLFLMHWQKEYNAFPEDMRSDEECKNELHQRVHDLCERLWEICDIRKTEAEDERVAIMNEGWLPDHFGLLTNHFVSLMQMEVDRYQDTCRVLKDYYLAMETDIYLKTKQPSVGEVIRLPLLQLSNEKSADLSKQLRVPLIQALDTRPVTSDTATSASDDPDEAYVKILSETLQKALCAIDYQVNVDATEEATEAKHPETTHTSKEKRKKKSPAKSKSQLHHSTPENVVTPVPNLSESEKEEIRMKEARKKEYHAAVTIEGEGLRLRLELVKSYADVFLANLKEKAKATYINMDDWLGKRFLAEMESIENMANLLKQAIEDERQLQDALVLDDDQFYVDDDLHMFRTPTPGRAATPVEENSCIVFTCSQLHELYAQFREVDPTGFISTHHFATAMMKITSNYIGVESVPEKWKDLSESEMNCVALKLSLNNNNLNWKAFLLEICKPYPLPTHEDLLCAVLSFKEFDHNQTGVVTREDYNKIELWFDTRCDEISDLRYRGLRELWFEVFSSRQDLLDYKDMLLYFVCEETSTQGLLSALCLLHERKSLPINYLRDDEPEEEFYVNADDLMKVLSHGECITGGNNRFDLYGDDLTIVKETLQEVARGSEEEVTLHQLYRENPAVRDVIDSCKKYTKLNIQSMFEEEAV